MSKSKSIKLSKKSKLLLDSAVESAKDWGWQQDQGVGRSVVNSEANFNTDVGNLGNHILTLEQQIKFLRAKNKRLQLNVSKVKYK